MAAPKKNDLAKLFKQAAEIASQVPESMQDAAFNRAVDMLSGAQTPAVTPNTSNPATPGGAVVTAPPSPPGDNEIQSVDQLLEVIDSTQHPEVGVATKVKDRALLVLRIALDDHKYDGMSTGEIAKVLTDKFRLSTSSNAVNMAISGEAALVNRVKKGRGFVYRLMDPGRAYIAQMGTSSTSGAPARRARKKKKRKAAAKSASKKKSKKKTKKKARKKSAKKTSKKNSNSRSSPGPKAAVLSLLDAGYFRTARTGAEVQEHLATKKGFQYGVDQLSLAMLRLVREEKLERDQNESGAYEYSET